MKIAVIDYGMGNLGSVSRAISELGGDSFIASNPEQLTVADRIILPGVGSFTDGMENLNINGWVGELQQQIIENGKPLLGICLGMQLLAESGSEGSGEEGTPGLSLISGEVVKLDSLGCSLRIPHVGWNSINVNNESGLLRSIPTGTDFYFVHSFAFRTNNSDCILATTNYDIPIVAVVGSGHILGTQFHPEKSSKAGFRVLKNFLEFKSC